jgi:hypothetical protein
VLLHSPRHYRTTGVFADTNPFNDRVKYYSSTTEFNFGIDLHARQMYVCLMDRQRRKLVHCNVRNNDFEFFVRVGHGSNPGL